MAQAGRESAAIEKVGGGPPVGGRSWTSRWVLRNNETGGICMPVYVIIDIEIKDKGPYYEYVDKVRPIVEKYNGSYLARGWKGDFSF